MPDKVYPRVCGGTDVLRLTGLLPKGLSPRVRGNRRARPPGAGYAGSIPACAGEPVKSQCGLRELWVYPRVCGGTAPAPTGYASSHGLSPRVRGNRAG